MQNLVMLTTLFLPCSCAGTTPNVNAAYLVDPVDGFALTQGKIGYPSAVKLLRDRSKKIGMTGMLHGIPSY